MRCSCGCDRFWRSVRAGGWWRELRDANGNIIETSTDRVTYGAEPKTVKCEDCGTRHPNPAYLKETS